MPRLDLVEQTVKAFRMAGIRVGVIQGQHYLTDSTAPVQICSEQTLARRGIQPRFDLVFVDECHIKINKILAYIDHPKMASVPVIGLSATPWSKGLGRHYRKLINPTSIQQLIERKILCPFTVFAPPGPDLTGVRTLAGDYHEGDLAEACDRSPLIANIVETWKLRGENRPTIIFAIDRQHAKHLEERFTEAGVACEYVDGNVEMFDRVDMFERFWSGETKIISSVATMDTGVDLPLCSCIIDARPTRSVIRDVQGLGRGLRIAPGKENLIILDHSGNTRRLGLVTDIDSDVLDNGQAVVGRERERGRAAPDIILCPECHFVLPKPKPAKCPQCEHVFYAVTPYQERDGELIEFGREARAIVGPTIHEQEMFFAMLQGYRARLKPHYKPTWPACQFKDKYGHWPNDWRVRNAAPMPPDIRTLNWIKSRAIAYAKARGRG